MKLFIVKEKADPSGELALVALHALKAMKGDSLKIYLATEGLVPWETIMGLDLDVIIGELCPLDALHKKD